MYVCCKTKTPSPLKLKSPKKILLKKDVAPRAPQNPKTGKCEPTGMKAPTKAPSQRQRRLVQRQRHLVQNQRLRYHGVRTFASTASSPGQIPHLLHKQRTRIP